MTTGPPRLLLDGLHFGEGPRLGEPGPPRATLARVDPDLFMVTARTEEPEQAAAERTGQVLVTTVDVPHAGLP